jgi:hypothetical protein
MLGGYRGDDQEVLRDQWHRDQFGIPEREYQAFRAQRNNARQRGIPFHFTLLAWHSWWRRELKRIGEHASRGRRRGQFMMYRVMDAGAYEVGNVYAGSAWDNMLEPALAAKRPDMAAKGTATCLERGHPRGAHLKVRGDGHPRSKAVITPLGRFGSVALASEAHGITRQGGHYAVKRGAWSYA